jgi:uncharacterized membrane protein
MILTLASRECIVGTRSKKNRRYDVLANPSQKPELSILVQMAQVRTGVIPPAHELEKLESFYPGVTKVLVDSYVSQVDHRIKIEEKVINGDDKRANHGQILSFILGMTALVSGAALIFTGKSVEGLAAIIAALATLLTAFFAGAFLRKKERENKKPANRKSK